VHRSVLEPPFYQSTVVFAVDGKRRRQRKDQRRVVDGGSLALVIADPGIRHRCEEQSSRRG